MRSKPEIVVSDGEPITGELVVVIDESGQANAGGGVTYVVTAGALFDHQPVIAKLPSIFPAGRKNPLHWHKEGPEVRNAICDLIVAQGVVALAQVRHVGRRQQVRARVELLGNAAVWAGDEGAEHVMIEASDNTTMSRDKTVLLDRFRDRGGVPFAYDWRTKGEPLLWPEFRSS